MSMSNAGLSEYERQRQENISQLQNEFSDLFDNLQRSTIDLANSAPNSSANGEVSKKRNNQKWNKIKMVSKRQAPEAPTVVRRSARIIKEQSESPNYNEESGDSDDDGKSKKSIRLKFPWFKSVEQKQLDKIYYSGQTDNDFYLDDEYFDKYEPAPKRRRTTKKFVPLYSVSQITQEMLDNIIYISTSKLYGKEGTTCHQCRQKTLDQKSCCRHKGCIGVRGMFCGFCLGNRYGEDVAVALKDPKWSCPPCRGYCNCSICRRKKGILPTGQLAQKVIADGYKSVRHFLSTTEGETCNEIENDTDNENTESKTDNLKDSNVSIENPNNVSNENIENESRHSSESIKKEYTTSNEHIENQNNVFNENIENEKENSIENIKKEYIVSNEHIKNGNKVSNKNIKKKKKVFNENIENTIEVKPTKKILINYCCNNDKDCKYHIEDGDDSQTIIDKYYKQLYL